METNGISPILAKLNFPYAVTSVSPFFREEDGSSYDVWKIETYSVMAVLKKTSPEERTTCEVFFPSGGCGTPRIYGFAEHINVTYAVIAGLLHDIAYCEEMVTREARMNHGRRSAAIARPFLETLDLSEDAVNKICYSIAIHVDDEADFEWERTLFCETVGDADNIDRFDAYRIYETLEYLKFSEMSLDDKREKVTSTIDRLTKYKEMKLGTDTAKNLWLQRLDYYIGFYEKLNTQLENSTTIW